MYVQRGQFGARARYQSVDLASRIEGATPHRLVQIMFDELIKAIDALTVAVRRRDLSQRDTCRAGCRRRSPSDLPRDRFPAGLRL